MSGRAAVRQERPTDRAQVASVHEEAFGRPDEAALVAALRKAARPQLSLVAEVDGRVVGHVFFSPASIEAPTPGAPLCAGLAPLGVLPTHQGRGIGSALVHEGIRRGPSLGWQALFVVGDPAYYARFGFALAAPRGLRYRDPDLEAVFQVLELREGAIGGQRGRVRFHESFETLGS